MIDAPTMTPYQVRLLVEASDPEDVKLLRHTRNNIRDRCCNPASANSANYGDRGIEMCAEWLADGDTFVAWSITHGWERGLTIDRIDNDGPYSPGNCQWTTPYQQARNRRTNVWVEVDGVSHIIADWAIILGVSSTAITNARRRGISPEEYIRTHLAAGHGKKKQCRPHGLRITVRGETKTTKEWAEILGVGLSAMHGVCKRNQMPMEVYISAHLDTGYGAKIYDYSRWIAEYEASHSNVGAEQKEET